MRILIIEDNPDIAGSIGDYLELQGHEADFASDGVMGLRMCSEHKFDVIILDINLPRMDGFEVCRQLRENYHLDTPVLMLTARGSLADKVTGFQMGAWDYLVKPFELQELGLRLDALNLRQAPNQARVLKLGELSLNVNTLQAERAGQALNLHRASLQLLEMLMRAAPNVVSRQELEFRLWGDEPPGSEPLRSHMYELRRELDKPFAFKMLKTVRGVGFALQAEENSHGN
ncbi:MAG: response regulator transcription factor [Pseudomonadales bacterium]